MDEQRDLVFTINSELMELEDALGQAQYSIEESRSQLQKLREKIERLDDLLYEAQEA